MCTSSCSQCSNVELHRLAAAHVDEDVEGDQVGGATLAQQLLEHIQRQIELARLDAHCK